MIVPLNYIRLLNVVYIQEGPIIYRISHLEMLWQDAACVHIPATHMSRKECPRTHKSCFSFISHFKAAATNLLKDVLRNSSARLLTMRWQQVCLPALASPLTRRGNDNCQSCSRRSHRFESDQCLKLGCRGSS